MEPQNPGNFPGPGPEVVKRQRVVKKQKAQRVRCWTVQNEMRGVLGQISAGASGSILDSVNPRKIRAQHKAVFDVAKTRVSPSLILIKLTAQT